MFETVIGALLPIVVTLLLGYIAGWHQDFDGKQAAVLNRMVMLYALPLSLFAGMMGTSRSLILSQGPLALILFIGMIGGYVLVYVISRYLCHRPMGIAALQALAISGPAVPFVGVSVLGLLLGDFSAVPIALCGVYMNLIQVPVTLVLLSYSNAQQDGQTSAEPTMSPLNSITSHIYSTLQEPVVWAPALAFVLLLCNFHFPDKIRSSLTLLGSATGGVALFASGIILYSRHVALTLAVSISVISRNLIIPFCILGLGMLFKTSPSTLHVAVLTLAIPTASIPVILAVQYKTAEQEMASTLFFSTIFSVLTMGLFIYLMT